MAFTIQLTNANFANYLARAIPYLSDAEALFIFGGDATQSAVNKITGTSGTWVGGGAAGTFADYTAQMNINYSLDSGISYAGFNKTVISVSEFQADEHSAFVGPQLEANRISGAFRAKVASTGYIGSAGDLISLNVPLFMGITSDDGTGNDTSYVGAAGSFITASAVDSPVSAANIVFGPRGGRDTFLGTGDTTYHKHYLGLIYGRELSGAEMAEVYAWAMEYMNARGLNLA